jgi:DNA-directed RNA polymerase II subunit RPB1
MDGIHPRHRGLSDIRMGPSVFGGQTAIRCLTDNLDVENCPGYFGHVKLARPVYHISFIKTVIHILSCISYWTSVPILNEGMRQRFSEENLNVKGEKRLKKVLAASKTMKKCRTSDHVQPVYKLSINESDGIRVLIKFPLSESKKNNKAKPDDLILNVNELLPLNALEILQKISNDDITFFGF